MYHVPRYPKVSRSFQCTRHGNSDTIHAIQWALRLGSTYHLDRENVHYDLLRTGSVERTTEKILARGFLDAVRHIIPPTPLHSHLTLAICHSTTSFLDDIKATTRLLHRLPPPTRHGRTTSPTRCCTVGRFLSNVLPKVRDAHFAIQARGETFRTGSPAGGAGRGRWEGRLGGYGGEEGEELEGEEGEDDFGGETVSEHLDI